MSEQREDAYWDEAWVEALRQLAEHINDPIDDSLLRGEDS